MTYREGSAELRVEAELELRRRDAQCDRLSAVLRRQHLDRLRARLREGDDPLDVPGNYTDCVLDPICNETR